METNKTKQMNNLLNEYKEWNSYKERNFIKQFASMEEIWLLLMNDEFIAKVKSDKKFAIFVRKKLMWVLDNNKEESYLLFKGFDEGETEEELIAISDQILLTYYVDNLTLVDLSKISYRSDPYNSIMAYIANSKRGGQAKAASN